MDEVAALPAFVFERSSKGPGWQLLGLTREDVGLRGAAACDESDQEQPRGQTPVQFHP
jgi:hypothetical protein